MQIFISFSYTKQILNRMKKLKYFYFIFFDFFSKIYAQNEISIKYIGADHTSNSNYHDGQLSPAIGTNNFKFLEQIDLILIYLIILDGHTITLQCLHIGGGFFGVNIFQPQWVSTLTRE